MMSFGEALAESEADSKPWQSIQYNLLPLVA
jgi:hypothetical protein